MYLKSIRGIKTLLRKSVRKENILKGSMATGKTQRDRVEREVGGGIGMGNTCKSMADSCQCMTKPTTVM